MVFGNYLHILIFQTILTNMQYYFKTFECSFLNFKFYQIIDNILKIYN